MKKLYFMLIALFVSVGAFAQVNSALSLVVQNQTNCTQYYQIFGDDPCRCGSKYVGKIFAIPPGATHNYANSTPFGNTYPTAMGRGIVGARIPDGPNGCATSGGTVGHQACNLPPVYTYMSISATCTPCAMTRATWIPAQNCELTARLIFTP